PAAPGRSAKVGAPCGRNKAGKFTLKTPFDGRNFTRANRLTKGDNMQIFVPYDATMDRFSAMRVFVRVAELSSFSAVAQQMGVARSVVT
ncbi:MAG: LysR family transcriptional regulator, partial [Burkholderiaceae bacterium]